MPAVSHVIFDLGQVLSLVDESVAVRAVARQTGRSEQHVARALFSAERKIPLESGHQTWREFSAMVRAELGFQANDDEFREIFVSVLTPNEQIFGLVRSLAAGYILGCCSNTSGPHWDKIRASVPVTGLFRPKVLSFEVGAMKPDQRIYRSLIDACGVEPEAIVFIDDNPANVLAASASGIQAVPFTGVSKLESDLRSLGIDWE